MTRHSIGSARMEPTEDTTTRVHIEYTNGETVVLYLEPGNGLTIFTDGPIAVEAYATENDESH